MNLPPQLPLYTGMFLALLWTWRLIAYIRHLPSIPNIARADWPSSVTTLPRLSVIVPARNEASAIEQCLRSLLALEYPDLEIIAVNDRSSDATGSIMDKLAAADSRLHVIHVSELPEGWMGKTHAMWLAAERSTGELLLFTDGDTDFHPQSLRRAVDEMLSVNADHFVLYPTLLFKSAGERMMVSFFQTMLCFIHRPWKISDPKAYDHVGVGAFNLIRRSAYEAIGTYKVMRMEVIDDLRLGRMVKEHGLRQHLVLGPGLVSLHWAPGAMGIVRNLSKNSFAALRFNWGFVLGAALGMLFVSLGPLLGAMFSPGWSRAAYIVALAAMTGVYAQTRRITGISPIYFLLHPIGAVLSAYILLRSAWLTSLHGVTWRGTNYPLKQFRKEAAKAREARN
ncbi:MAG TPA: glycosyltransferase family 2 protein [Terriglobales bacterium]|nr:glycosyltransferase family 2 protein [Terriglobales bacterium]